MQLSFNVPRYEDVDIEYNRVVKAGGKPIIAPNTKREAYIADPEGNLIEFVSSNE